MTMPNKINLKEIERNNSIEIGSAKQVWVSDIADLLHVVREMRKALKKLLYYKTAPESTIKEFHMQWEDGNIFVPQRERICGCQWCEAQQALDLVEDE
jgi:hypothetical protein